MSTTRTCPYCDGYAEPGDECFCDDTGVVTLEELEAHAAALMYRSPERDEHDRALWNAGLHRSDAFGSDIPW